MTGRTKRIVLLNCFRLFPHLIILSFHQNKEIVYADVKRWMNVYGWKHKTTPGFLRLMITYPEFRNVFYYRIRRRRWQKRWFLNFLCPAVNTLYIKTPTIGKGLFIQHGFATIIAALSIGENFWVNQQVTIGYTTKIDAPVILDNVTIHAGAKVLGNVILGNNSIVGANAVVVKNVPADCTVVGVPAYIVKRSGKKVKENL